MKVVVLIEIEDGDYYDGNDWREVIGVYATKDSARKLIPTLYEQHARDWLKGRDNKPQGPKTIASREQWISDCLVAITEDDNHEIRIAYNKLPNPSQNGLFGHLDQYTYKLETWEIQP